MSSWDIPWCLGRDFNIIKFPSQRCTNFGLSLAMGEFFNFFGSYKLVDPPLEGVRFTWSSHEEIPVLTRIDWFRFSADWEEYFQGVHQVILLKITSDHFSFFFGLAKSAQVDSLSNPERCGLG